MTVAELIAELKALPPEAEVFGSGYGVPLPTVVVHDVSGYGDKAFLGLCTPETAEREKAFNASRGHLS
jgi:hypothetical protein